MELEEIGFRRLSAEDMKIFQPYYDKMNDDWASSLCFTSMVAWRHSIEIFYKQEEEFIICLAYDSTTERIVLLPFFGYYTQERINRAMQSIVKLLEDLEIEMIMTDVSKWMLPYYEAVPNIKWKLINDPGLCDYIYQKEDFISSMNTQEVRYNYNYFVRKFEPETVVIKPENVSECVEFIESEWCCYHSCDECQYGCLQKTAMEAISNINFLNEYGILVRVKGQMVGYCLVTEYKGLAIYQFKKTQRSLRGLNEYLHKECFDRFLQNARVINYTEDMGLEGLRKYKSRLAPHTLSPKYELQKQ